MAALAADFPQVVVQVGHVERFNPAVVAAQKVFDRPWYASPERLGPFKPRSLDVDVIDDLMIHDLDLCLAWMGGEVTDVRALGVSVMTHLVDMANARIEFAKVVRWRSSRPRASLESSRKLRLFTEQRYLSLDLEKKEAKSVRRLKAAEPGGWPEIEGEPVAVEPHDALLAEAQSFIAACLAHTAPLVTLQDGLRAVRLAWLSERENAHARHRRARARGACSRNELGVSAADCISARDCRLIRPLLLPVASVRPRRCG